MQLFGTAGIRGITNEDITPELALMVGKAYGSVFQGKLAVARDTRHGAEMIAHSIISGLLATGNDVYDLGIVPLPVFARYVADFMDGGIIVTGSHTPPQIMGIVAVDSLGRDLYWDMSEKIEKIYQTEEFHIANWQSINDSVKEDAIEHYTQFVEKQAKNIDGYSVLLDLANGSACGVWERILSSLGVNVSCINCKRKHVPSRPSEPRRTTVTELISKSKDYDLGAGVDVDADRVVFAADGKFVSEDITGAIFAKRLAKRMVTPINSSSLVNYIAKEYGIKVIQCPIGPPEIAEAMIVHHADFGYEETGKYVFPPNLWGDSLLSIIKMLSIMNTEGKSLIELAAEFPRFYQIKEKIVVPRSRKREIVDKIGALLEKSPPKGVEDIVKIDGVKLIYEDSWLLIRASGTEDVIRVFSDSKSEKKARELVDFGKRLVQEQLK